MKSSGTFTFDQWQSWLEHKAEEPKTPFISAECKHGGEPTPKPCCSFRLWTDAALGQFDVWETGEADYSVMDARSKAFVCHVWGLKLDDLNFKATFEEFSSRVTGFQ